MIKHCIFDPASLLAGVKKELFTGAGLETLPFDKCLFSNNQNSFRYARQEKVFEEVGLPVIDWVLSFNSCVFAFGQTGSGKTCYDGRFR